MKRILSLLVAMVMTLGCVGISAMAEESATVAKIGETTYASLADAINDADAGQTVTLVKDILGDGKNLTISKDITLDLGGYTFTDAYITTSANVTIKNGSIKNTNESYPIKITKNTLTVEDITLEASKSDRAIWVDGGTLNFYDSSILATKGENNTKSQIYGIWVSTGTTANIYSGSITVDAGPNATAVAIFGNYVNTVNVYDGKISTSGKNYSYAIWTEGDVTVFDGEIVTNEKKYGYSSGITYGYNYAINTKGNVTISGGTITTNGSSGYLVNAGGSNQKITVSDVEFTNVLTEADKTAGNHKAPKLINGSSVTVEISGGQFDGVADIDPEYVVLGSTITVDGETYIKTETGLEETVVVAKIGDVEYTDLHTAMTSAKAGETVELLSDVDLFGAEWEPVSFKGKFNGNGYKIKNLTINKPGVSNTGFITSLNGTFENVTFENPTVTGGENTGVLAGRAGGSSAYAKDINVTGIIKVETTHSGYARAGAIVGGWAYGKYENITVDGTDKAISYIKHTGGGDGRYVAGIVGHADDVDAYINCTVKNIKISGGWLCGGIAGPGPSDGKATGCAVENIDMGADYSGGMFGWYHGPGTIENSSVKDVTFTDGSTNNGAIGGYSNNTAATVTNVTIENVKNADGAPLLSDVAKIGDTTYATLEEAFAAANDGDTVTLLWKEGDAPIAMNGAVFGKTVIITGAATVDWNQGFLFVGRGGEGNGTVIFDNANLASASNSGAYGIHVSGREKDTNNKYDGTLTIKDSAIELDYLINRGVINVDNSTLTVKNGFGIAGRPASETESGEAATATINIANESYVKVLNHNGMGVGVASATSEGNGVLNLTDSTFECASFNIDAKLGDFNVYGESTLNIGTLTGKEIDLHHNAVIKDSCVGGEVMLYGKVTFRGDNTFSMLSDYGNAYSTEYAEWIVEKGASVTLTEKARYGLGYGDKVTIYGNLEDALTARETLTEDDISLFTHGLVAMSSWDVANSLSVKDAYVVIGSNNSFGNTAKSGYSGTYDIDIENTVLDASRITFYAAESKTDFSFKDSDVKVGTFMTRDTDSVFTLNNTKLVSTTTTNGTDEGNYHAGTLNLKNSSITYSAPLVMENGTLTLGENSSLTAPTITGTGKIVIDATGMTAGEATNISGNASGFTGTIEVINNDSLEASIDENGNIVLTEAPEVKEPYIFGKAFYMVDLPEINGRYQVGLYAGIDSLKYKEVGFKIYDQNDRVIGTNSTNTVYTSVKGSNMTVTAELIESFRIFGATAEFGKGWDNIPVFFRPYALDLNGKEILGYKYKIADIYPATAITE